MSRGGSAGSRDRGEVGGSESTSKSREAGGRRGRAGALSVFLYMASPIFICDFFSASMASLRASAETPSLALAAASLTAAMSAWIKSTSACGTCARQGKASHEVKRQHTDRTQSLVLSSLVTSACGTCEPRKAAGAGAVVKGRQNKTRQHKKDEIIPEKMWTLLVCLSV